MSGDIIQNLSSHERPLDLLLQSVPDFIPNDTGGKRAVDLTILELIDQVQRQTSGYYNAAVIYVCILSKAAPAASEDKDEQAVEAAKQSGQAIHQAIETYHDSLAAPDQTCAIRVIVCKRPQAAASIEPSVQKTEVKLQLPFVELPEQHGLPCLDVLATSYQMSADPESLTVGEIGSMVAEKNIGIRANDLTVLDAHTGPLDGRTIGIVVSVEFKRSDVLVASDDLALMSEEDVAATKDEEWRDARMKACLLRVMQRRRGALEADQEANAAEGGLESDVMIDS